ncbi:response regulator transcription factor [Marinomonas sp. 15G1-11]|uniref:Response regulator transcription factor n=1 Tax=Marinomonas phaeophyticola TaxID=3004091 RepID=A0ABT4JZC2_9GAMM|nr:response regulator transcription factor [Marinomonas sp. 15G1-11]MCZ2723742.1 response regulator transcription factor [Marinomonas sp. 15G1-11]
MLEVLIVEDDRDLALSIGDHLECEKIVCDYASNGLEGALLIEKNHYDVIILDINMQGMDGLSLCEKMRGNGIDTPILMLTARDTLENKIEGFRAGADDYLVKPFDIEELIARLHALSKRRSGQVSKLVAGPLELDLNRRIGTLHNQEITLTPTAFKLLEILLRASPNPVSKASLTQNLWGDDLPDSNKLRVHIHKIRKILSTNNSENILKTSPSFGFYIEK